MEEAKASIGEVWVMDYDRRTASVSDLESVLHAWMRQAVPVLVQNVLAQARLPGAKHKIQTQPNGAQIDIVGRMPLDPSDRTGHGVQATIHIEWFIGAGMDFDTGASVTFEGGGKTHRDFRFSWDNPVGEQGVDIGLWIRGLEPVAPDM